MFVDYHCHLVSRLPSPSSASSRDWGRAPGLVLGGIWLLAQDSSVSSLLTHFAHPEQPPGEEPAVVTLLGCDWLPSPNAGLPLVPGQPPGPGLRAQPPLVSLRLHAALLATLETFIYIKKCFNSSNKLHSKLVLIRICPVMPFWESDTNLICPCHSTIIWSLSFFIIT